MRYSQILGEKYHQIKFSEQVAWLIDLAHTGASHHLVMYRKAVPGSIEEAYHSNLFERHLTRLKEIVYTAGDFKKAVDPTGEKLHRRSSWSPNRKDIPDCRMFANAEKIADSRYGLGMEHINDKYLNMIEAI